MSDAWVLSGPSGAGLSTALRALEHCGVACTDNLPPTLLGGVDRSRPVAVTIDARQGDAIAAFVPPPGWRVLFIDAQDPVLVRRQAESTRPHPCAAAGGGEASVRAERELLVPLRAAADSVIDSSALTTAELAERVLDVVRPAAAPDVLRCTVSSFGFKYGAQPEADWVVDARFLRNPFWEPTLRPLTGNDAAVRDYVLAQGPARELIERLTDLMTWCIAQAREHGRSRLHLAVGCTGGRHRSVVLAGELAARLRAVPGIEVVQRHRDVERPDPR